MSVHRCRREAGKNGDACEFLRLTRENPSSPVSLCLSLLLAWILYSIAIWYSSVHFPKPHLLQRTLRHPAAAVMAGALQSLDPNSSITVAPAANCL